MRMHGVSADEVAQQLGHRKLGVTGVDTEYDPQYLSAACRELDNLLKAVLRHGLLAKYLPEDPGSCRSSVVEHSLGKGEVVCSIHTGSTSRFPEIIGILHDTPVVRSASSCRTMQQHASQMARI
jgi:hypothetical protein